MCISIHAPAWGATRFSAYCGLVAIYFNPRPRVGGDPAHNIAVQRPQNFNPRPRVGGDDVIPIESFFDIKISIHAPAWGATLSAFALRSRSKIISIHAPAWGATGNGGTRKHH